MVIQLAIELYIVFNIPAASEHGPEHGIMLDVVRIFIFRILFHLECYPRLQVPNSRFVAHFSSLIITRFPVCLQQDEMTFIAEGLYMRA